METVHVIADFEMSFAQSFKTSARVKWGVDFENSNIDETIKNLQQLKHNMQNGNHTPSRPPYEITLHDVERVEALLNELLKRWKQLTNVPVHPKLYHFLRQLREMETPSVKQQTKEILNDILTSETTPNQTKAEKRKAEVEAKMKELALKDAQKQNKKR